MVLAGLIFTLLVTSAGDARRYGDNLQIALPLLGFACEASRGAGGEFALRFAAMMTLAHGTKRMLGETEMNRRPNGGHKGFPSAHTAAAVLGASALVHGCLKAAPPVQAAVILAAGFVGASRIQVGAHDIWQVLAGALLGWGCERALRHDRARREHVRRALLGLRMRFAAGATRAAGRGRIAAAQIRPVVARMRRAAARAHLRGKALLAAGPAP